MLHDRQKPAFPRATARLRAPGRAVTAPPGCAGAARNAPHPRRLILHAALAAIALGTLLPPALRAAMPVDLLRSVGALPPHLAGLFSDPAGFRQISSGDYLVFDRRGHTVYRVDAAMTSARKIVQVGHEAGRILQPVAFAVSSDDNLIVADAPAGRERVQRFTAEGTRLGGFALAGRLEVRVRLDSLVLNGVGSLQYEGESIYVNQPESGSLVTEYSLEGQVRRSFGLPRATGYEAEKDLHAAFNTGLPLVNPAGGFYFVFQTGEPRLRKYSADGTLIFERVIQGPEVDALRATQPTSWPRRAATELPAVPPVVRTAAVDARGRLWVALTLPFTYVFDADGEKVRVVQFRAAGILAPSSLAFTPDGRLLATPGCYVFELAGDR